MRTLKISPIIESAVTAIIVTYNPDLLILSEVVDATWSQVHAIVIVDNGSSIDMAGWVASLAKDNIHVICLEANLGIAAAQNVGIHWAQQHGSDFLLLLDQDSTISDGMVEMLLSAFHENTCGTVAVSAVGPKFIDSITGHPADFLCISRFGIRRAPCKHGKNVVPVDFLIASGSLISMACLMDVGDMDCSLFIDHVDVEWIFRARAKGYHALGHCQATMAHSIGERRIRVWFLRRRNIPFHKPFRYYYLFRNGIELSKRNYIPLSWKIYNAIRLIQFLVVMGILHPQRNTALRMMLRGTKDGFLGKLGPLGNLC